MKFLVYALTRVLIPICILASGGYGFAVLSVEPPEDAARPVQEQKLRSRVTSLSVCDYAVKIETHGIVSAHNRVTLSAEVTGVIRSIEPAFEAGSFFQAGELLLEIDDRDYQIALKVAREQHKLANATLELAETAHERMEQLARQRSASTSEVDGTLAALVQAQAQVAITASAIETAERNLQRTKIYAPFDGRVVSKTIGVGQLVSSGTILGDVFAVDYAEVRLPISGRDLRHLKLPEREGDPSVEVELRDAINSSNGFVWEAKIVRTEGTLDADSLELFAIARIDDPFSLHSKHSVLRIGQPVVAKIRGEKLRDVVVIPRGAVRRLDQVYLIDENRHTLRSLTIDPLWSDAENVVVSGHSIEQGELLATTMLVYAPEGSPVEIIPEDPASASLAGQPPELEATP
ncbi:efflux RND transporter periplasmic adaptor subunit [Aporhodopirellula aestuarii]|uniref:Efflux RND transporter periplasmic adaptor subunit n=1 Tax=Aporhodopirellula aestuarii TaxID=2950107 RepID=A0ABT0TYZ9_9BACT|nr:efflux RND transporter periplasmic adaptor subunit [Aporhodopirellula aestuarii]MCM2369823.1 efflux RND transporter periplasmic adaptor subunit [Aporhodopirellula aestuarii]